MGYPLGNLRGIWWNMSFDSYLRGIWRIWFLYILMVFWGSQPANPRRSMRLPLLKNGPRAVGWDAASRDCRTLASHCPCRAKRSMIQACWIRSVDVFMVFLCNSKDGTLRWPQTLAGHRVSSHIGGFVRWVNVGKSSYRCKVMPACLCVVYPLVN